MTWRRPIPSRIWLLAACLLAAAATPARPEPGGGQAQSGGSAQKPAQGQPKKPAEGKPLPQISPDALYDYQGEATLILQSLLKFHSPYEGPQSFRSRNETEFSHTYTLFLGARVVPNVEVYVNPEIALGNGVGGDQGLAGSMNGDLIGQSSLRPEPYLARYFVRWRIPMPRSGRARRKGERIVEETGRAPNVIAGAIPAHRLVIQAGKFGVSDVFDVNSYANNPREQFLNDAFGNNLAYDFAQETRGYGLGVTAAWINPGFAVRAGTFAMPTAPGGPDLAYNLSRDHSEQVEVELHPQWLQSPKPPLILRMIAYRNVGTMGRYRDALRAELPGMPPTLDSVRKRGAAKSGVAINFEQALGDGGDTGVFGRFGWSDGSVESYSFSEADRFLSFGAQISGARWKRKEDRVGVAIAQSDLSSSHKNYLAAGGLGLTLGDGRLNYRPERTIEAYYLYQTTKHLSLTLDYQFITDPGYNKERGPVSLLAVRAHLTF